MDWVKESIRIFNSVKPEHFTNFMHCDECFDHDETLRNSTVEKIGMRQLGNPAWDPMCFCSTEGKKYYMPALIRLCIETIKSNNPYLMQFLFILEWDGKDNDLIINCTTEQRSFVASFVQHLIETYTKEIEDNSCTDNALRVYEIWKPA
jgi:hypothetical protein